MSAQKVLSAPVAKAGEVLEAIWEIVHQRGLKPGDQLPPIRELADRLDLKSTAIRDALVKAETMGLVRILPHGAFLRVEAARPPIATPSLSDALGQVFQTALVQRDQNLFHLLDARRLIEIELVGRAAERRQLEDLLPVRKALEAMLEFSADAPRYEYVGHDIRFHVETARLAGNQVLFSIQQTVMELLRPYLNDIPRDGQRTTTTDQSHIAIYEALVAGDSQRARREMNEHLSLAYDGLLRDIQAVPFVESSSSQTVSNSTR